jgi:TRAP-type C4-dicarboxylate transport system permease small subunit
LKLKKYLETASGLLAGVALFAIMVLTFLDVGGRKLLEHSITGSLEMTELLMVVVIFGALPLVSERGEHVVFDSLDAFLPNALQKVQRSLVHLLCGVALLALGWLMWQTGNDFSSTGETTAQLKILKAPFIYGMGLLCAFTGFIHLTLMLHPMNNEEAEGGVL